MAPSGILVLGATGKIGSHLVNILKQKNVEFTVFVREPNAVRDLAGPNVKVVAGDIFNVESFKAAVSGKSRLFLLSNFQSWEKTLMKTAADAGVQHIVKLSVLDANVGEVPGSIFHGHGVAEKELLEIPNVKWTILRPHLFMQNMLRKATAFKGETAYTTGHPTAYMGSIDTRDIAEVAATVLTEPIEKHAGMTYVLTGPEAIKDKDMIGIASKVLGKKIALQEIDDAQLFEMYTVKHGIPRQMALSLVDLEQHYRAHMSAVPFTTGDVKIVTGKEPRSYENFFTDYKNQLLTA
jgi:uncharacterized protein YbjT (DUF2867 family)